MSGVYTTDEFEDSTWRRVELAGVTHRQVLRWLSEAVGTARRRRAFFEDPRKAETITIDVPEEAGAEPQVGADRGLLIAVTLGLIVGGLVAAVLIVTA